MKFMAGETLISIGQSVNLASPARNIQTEPINKTSMRHGKQLQEISSIIVNEMVKCRSGAFIF